MTPQELKLSILRRAFQGKLVDQIFEEGTGADLLPSIQAECHNKIITGQIKKFKVFPEITDEDVDFDVPNNWKLVRLGTICQLLDGENRSGEAFPYLEARYLRGKTASTIITEGKYIAEGTNVILVDGENSGEVFHIPEDGYMGSTFKVLFVPEALFLEYVIYFLQLHKNTLRNNKKGAAIPHLNKDIFFNLILPIPPLAEQKRIVAKIEELLPLIDRYEQAWSKLEEFNKRFPVDMQKSILQMAIQGKLVPQFSEEGTGKDLFQRIQAEKQALIKTGTIKKEKPLPEITEDEVPFEIPENWRWVQLGDLCSVVTGRLDANAQKPDGNYAFFTCGREVFKTDTYAFDCDAILLGGNNASGDYKMHRYAGKFNAYQRVYVISGAAKDTLDFLYYVVTYWLEHLKRNSQGTTTRFIKLGQVTGMLIPFPPLAEQKRIVAKLEEILPLCEKLK